MSDDPENTGAQREVGFCKPPVETQFKAGNHGRPKGSRNRFAEAFINDFLADWEVNGKAAIAVVRETKPAVYLRTAVAIVPREYNLNMGEVESLSDAELDARLAELEARAAALSGREAEAHGNGSSADQPALLH